MRNVLALLLCFAVLLPAATGADETSRSYAALSDAELAARIGFIEERLDAGEKYTKIWQWGWTGVDVIGMAIGTAQAATTHSGKNRADHITTAVKSLIGTTRYVFWPHPGRNGADAIDAALFASSRSAQERRLQRGEQILEAVAEKARRRTNWKAHAANVGLNLAGAGFILGLGHASDAAESFGIGVAVGTAQILSAPKRGLQDLDAYHARFGRQTAKRFHWSLTPTIGGATLNVRF